MKLERAGVGLAMLCAIHCMALPILAGTASVLPGSPLDQPWVEAVLLGGAAVIGYSTLGLGFRRHGRPWPLAMLTTGFCLMVLAHLALPKPFDLVGTLCGAFLLVAAQIGNVRCLAAGGAACCAAPHAFREGRPESTPAVSSP